MMNICLLDTVPVTFSEKLAYGGRMMLIGMGIVFSVLLILWGSLELMRLFCYVIPQRKKRKTETDEPAAPPPAPCDDGEEEEIVAVLAAAVAAAETETPQTRFRAVSFKRIN